MSDDEQLFAELRTMWVERDPMPEGLDDLVIAALAAEDIDMEYELLFLVERDQQFAGARTTTSTSAQTALSSKLEFSNGTVTVLLRIAGGQVGTSRIDGWVTPAQPMTARVVVKTWVGETFEHEVGVQDGRFVLAEVPHGLVRIWLSPQSSRAKPLATPLFEI